MYGNGVPTGLKNPIMPLLRRPIPRALHLALSAFFGVVVGAAMRGTVVWLAAMATVPAAGSTATACALPNSSYPKREKKENIRFALGL